LTVPCDKTEKVIVSVKSGNVGVKDVRDLIAVVKREKAAVGVLLTLNDPTKPMLSKAANEGDFTCDFGKYPRVQILTIGDIFNKKRPSLPPQNAEATMKTTAKEKGTEGQAALALQRTSTRSKEQRRGRALAASPSTCCWSEVVPFPVHP
jgi:Restriction endonuclease